MYIILIICINKLYGKTFFFNSPLSPGERQNQLLLYAYLFITLYTFYNIRIHIKYRLECIQAFYHLFLLCSMVNNVKKCHKFNIQDISKKKCPSENLKFFFIGAYIFTQVV